MRVIAGIAKGHPLKAPKTRLTRPATDLVRGAIFSILENMDANWSQVLDLYSGSGAMGIEALSRGAEWVDFVEHNPQACNIIIENLEKTKLAAQSHIYCRDVGKAISTLDKKYDIIIIDPPYRDTSIGDTLAKIADSKLMGDDTVLVVTHSSHLSLSPVYNSMKMVKERRHGDSFIAIYRKEGKS